MINLKYWSQIRIGIDDATSGVTADPEEVVAVAGLLVLGVDSLVGLSSGVVVGRDVATAEHFRYSGTNYVNFSVGPGLREE